MIGFCYTTVVEPTTRTELSGEQLSFDCAYLAGRIEQALLSADRHLFCEWRASYRKHVDAERREVAAEREKLREEQQQLQLDRDACQQEIEFYRRRIAERRLARGGALRRALEWLWTPAAS